MIYPFKLLDAYLEKDKEIFFGRQEEIDLLYEMVFQTNVLLVYGASGTGKTSLIQCGLAGKFQTHDWLALNIRRGTNINQSFDRAIAEAAGNNEHSTDHITTTEEVADDFNPLENSFRAIYLNNFRPIYLIFDQLEEIYILGDKEEQDLFIKTVKNILTVEQPVKIIFSIREEYLAFLYEFEKSVPQLLRKKLRIEKMNLDKVRQVITGIAGSRKTNIILKEPDIELFVDNLFKKVRGREQTLTIQLPYLQVYLDKLYLHITNDETRKAKAMFSPEALLAFGGIDDVLKDFLEDQVQVVTKILVDKRIQVTRENIWSILWPFVTMEGTKAPASLASIQHRLNGEVPEKTVEEAINALVSRRVLRYLENDNLFEIAHDSLGNEIAKNRSPEQSKILEAERIIKSRFSPDPTRQDFLNAWQLEYIKPIRRKLKITEEQNRFVDLSIKRERRRNLSQNAIIITTIVGLILVSIIMNNAKNRAQDARKQAEDATIVADKAKEDAIRSQQQADSALAKQIIASENEMLARKRADAASLEATRYASSLAISQHAANLSAQQARQDRDKARESAEIADSSRRVAYQQKHLADSLRTAENNKKNITQSIQFALESILSEKPYEKISLATQSYDLNAEHNHNAWVPQITEALAKAVPDTSMQEVLSLPNSVLDIIPVAGSTLLIITDAGEIRSFDLLKKDSSKLLWSDKRFHYVNNSGYFDRQKSQLVIKDMDNMVYVFSIHNSAAELREKYLAGNEKSSLISRETLVLFSRELRTQAKEGNNLIFNFDENFGSTFELSADKNIVVAGTTNGWLYLSEYPIKSGQHFKGLFQLPNSRVNDIAIDKQGLFFATAGADSRLRLTTTKLVESAPLEYRFNSWVNAISFVAPMKLLIGTAEGKLYILNFNQDELAASCRKKNIYGNRGMK
ncbi:ATP-binding protein [Flavitalea sp.]|nr:AAA family ATPase [Flavitalea sp.]